MSRQDFDVVVLGGGPGGYVAALRAAQLGLRAALVEREHLGGICLNWGCIPTKALLRSAEIGHTLRHLPEFGWRAEGVSLDLPAMVARSRRVAGQLAGGVQHLLNKNKVAVFRGAGRLDGPGRVAIALDAGGKQSLAAPHIVLATGARARPLPLAPEASPLIWTYREAMIPQALPARLIVVGAGAIGIEFASFYRDLGAEVTVLETLDRILPAEDAEISAYAQGEFERDGMRILTGAVITAIDAADDRVRVRLRAEAGDTLIEADRLISAVGILGNTEGLGLEGTGVAVERSHVRIDAFCRTGEPGVYAIGDLAGPPWLAHKASHEGVLCVEAIAGVPGVRPIDWSNIPGCTYCRPQIASVGLTEAAARAAGLTPRIGRFPFLGNGRAIAIGEPRGMVKTIFDASTGALLGAHMVGAEVTELIQGFVIARTLETTEEALMQTVFAHPTLSEAMHESVLDAYGMAMHV